MEIPVEGLRLNLGCGRSVRDGWYNVDIAVSPRAPRPPELLSDVKRIPMLPDACAVEIEAIHIFEHLYRWECDETLAEWRRLLRPGGRLVMEMPDIMKVCRNILKGQTGGNHPDQLGLWGAYGDDRERDVLLCHHWGWTFATLAPLLKQRGFTDIKEEITQYHSIGRGVRDFRVVSKKAVNA